MRDSRILRVVVAAISAALLFIVSAIPAWSMTVTFVRHGESQANAAHIIETDIPGRGLTERGHAEAAAVAEILARNGHDKAYSSPLLRTLETARHFADDDSEITRLEGMREIPGGWFEGARDDSGLERLLYGLPGIAWALGLRFIPVLGSEDGNAFDARVNAALRQIHADYLAGETQNPVVFGHGGTIMFWTMMNVDNPDLLLMLTHTLGNTETVVIEGSPDEGWTLVSWAGVEVSRTPSLPTTLFVRTRDLLVAPQTALYNLGQALRTGDVVTVVEALRDGILDVVTTAVRYVPNVVRDIVDSVLEREAQQPPQTSAERLETAGHRSRSDTGPGVTAPASGAPAATPEARPTRAEVTTELTAELTTELTAGPRPGPGAEPESAPGSAEETDLAAVPALKPHGATDLSTGNKVEPEPVRGVSRPRATLRDTAGQPTSVPAGAGAAAAGTSKAGAVTRCRACA